MLRHSKYGGQAFCSLFSSYQDDTLLFYFSVDGYAYAST
jgi:hypothetical protein